MIQACRDSLPVGNVCPFCLLASRQVRQAQLSLSWLSMRMFSRKREDPDEEQEAFFESMPVVLNNEVIDSYGGRYSITE